MFKPLISCYGPWLAAVLLTFGCNPSRQPETPAKEPAEERSATVSDARRGGASRSPHRVEDEPSTGESRSTESPPPESPPPESTVEAYLPPELDVPAESRFPGAPSGTLGDLLTIPDSPGSLVRNLPRVEVDEKAAARFGIRKLTGERLTLFTDLASDDEVDRLPEVFDRAFPQWCAYFGIDREEHADWKMTGFLMNDKQRFVQTGLLPPKLPPFEHGFSRNFDLWLYEQPSAYYRRHLLLHEGTHGFMNTMLGSCGPTWYMEGVAELLATHRWGEGRLELNWIPTSREEVPMWGRIKIINEAFQNGEAIGLDDVIRYRVREHHEAEPYAWCWAAACLLDGHPAYRDRFRRLSRFVREPDFSERFRQLVGDDWDDLAEQWAAFVANLEYGHDIQRTMLDFTPGKPLAESRATVSVAADRGWQNSGLQLDAGKTYRLRARGRYQVAEEPQIWWCEPGGVSIRYHHGLPLGVLLGAVRPDEVPHGQPRTLIRSVTIGLEGVLAPSETGTLFLRVNDSDGELHDNAGSLVVEVERETEPAGDGSL
jgi:hypothetical protein